MGLDLLGWLSGGVVGLSHKSLCLGQGFLKRMGMTGSFGPMIARGGNEPGLERSCGTGA